MSTVRQYNAVMEQCRELFVIKTRDYGTAWAVLRPSSLTDQLFIKAKRLRTLEEKNTQRVADQPADEYIGIINYSLMAIIQLERNCEEGSLPDTLSPTEAIQRYDEQQQALRDLMLRKNHDYGEAWRYMRISSMTDLILMKLMRIKQIEDNAGHTIASEGLQANYQDIANYAIFALILLSEQS